uniref:LIM domain protein n=1 Tax=Syphacia muris TaxID=451379 RepID=A0A0N5ADV0_9BILA
MSDLKLKPVPVNAGEYDRAKGRLGHQTGEGSRCLKCDCPGLDLHYWRLVVFDCYLTLLPLDCSKKVCKNCMHKMDDHDVIDVEEDHGKMIIGKLFDLKEHSPIEAFDVKHSESSMAIPIKQKKKSKGKAEGNKAIGVDAEVVKVGGIEGKVVEGENIARGVEVKGVEVRGVKANVVKARGIGGKVAESEDVRARNRRAEDEEEEDAEEAESTLPVPAAKFVYIFQKNFPISQYNVTIENPAGKDRAVEYTWVPTNDTVLIEKYFAALPEEERPISGTAGALDRRQKLQYQLPYHDSNAAAARSLKTDEDIELHTKFIKTIKEKVVGVGQLIEWTEVVRKIKAPDEGGRRAGPVGERGNYGRCRTCGVFMKVGDVGVITDHGNKTEVWHPNCFRCHTCHQRLVDMLYFYKDGEYYCGRHFGDSMYPRCAGCDELIFSKEYTFAESKNWHFDHFCCFGCDKELGGHRYMVRDEQPYCFECYMRNFAKTCRSCHGKIAPDQQRISYKNLHWHADGRCFQCRACHKVLLNQRFIIKSSEVFCSSNCKNAHYGKGLIRIY